MATHLTEEEQIEAIKRWWKKNGVATVAAVVLSVGGFWGWHLYQGHVETRGQEASIAYESFVAAVARFEDSEGGEVTESALRAQAETLMDEYSRSMYADFAALYLARLAVEQADLGQAQNLLERVYKDGANDTVKDLARLRLARVKAAAGEIQAGLDMLSEPPSGAYASAYAEARGDMLQSLNRRADARSAYETALESMNDPRSVRASLIQLKIDNTRIASETAEPTPGMDQELRPNPHQAPTAGGA